MKYSPVYDRLCSLTTAKIDIYDAKSGKIVSTQTSKTGFTDLDITPDGRYLFAADNNASGSYVHRCDLVTNTWESGRMTGEAYRIEAISDEQAVTLERDQWVDLVLIKFSSIAITELSRISSDYYGDIEYDHKTNTVIHGNSGLSSREISTYKVSGNSLSSSTATGGYGSAQNGGGTAILTSNGKYFFYGALQVEAIDVTNNIRTIAETIYAASSNVAFGKSGYYSTTTGSKLGNLTYATQIITVSNDGYHFWAYNSSTYKVQHYLIDQGLSSTLSGMEIIGNSSVSSVQDYQYTTNAIYSDGSRKDVSNICNWSIDSSAFGSISTQGLLTTSKTNAGTITISVTWPSPSGTISATKQVTYKPANEMHQLTLLESIAAGGQAYQLEYSDKYKLLFMRNSGSAVRIVDTNTKTEVEIHYATETFSDMDLTPDEKYLFVADYGSENMGYGTPVRQHYVHRYDLEKRIWEVLKEPKIAYKIEGVSANRVLMQEHDQHVDMTLNSFVVEDGAMKELSRISADYYGDFEYDYRNGRVYHGSSGSSSREIHVRKLVGDILTNAGSSGTYGTAQNGGGTCVLSSDGKYFYYGKLQVEALDVTNNRNFFPEVIYAGSEALAFGSGYYYDAEEGGPVGSLGYACSVMYISDDSKHLWTFQDDNDTLHHYRVGPEIASTVLLESVLITGPGTVARHTEAQFIATACYDNDTSFDVSKYATWSIEPKEFASVSETGVVTFGNQSNVMRFTLTASYSHNDITVKNQKNILYIPDKLVIFVDPVNGNDDNLGISQEEAMATVAKAVSQAQDGDTIMLMPGVYTESINFHGKAITITSESDAAVIDGGSSQIPAVKAPVGSAMGGVVFENNETSNSILKNIVIRNCLVGIYCGDSSPTIKNVTVVNNGIGVMAWDNAQPLVTNSIFYYNTISDVENTEVHFCCGQSQLSGSSNIAADPLFVAPLDNNYHLSSRMGHYDPATNDWLLDDVSSPCIDMASPGEYPQDEVSPNGGRANMGAYGTTAYASKSPNGWLNIADLDQDGIVNLSDLGIMSENWLWTADWYTNP
ncbi:MAG: hypothetical protein JW745_06725 [Sedimentisphaerales bacterium]|nr:hypothetical protein [Sedimentisphaerales bacterium]MBN2841873.1 hypothetical protein [Sedimentisphaerales bacterium]